jgi:methionyl-tRNA synthetase
MTRKILITAALPFVNNIPHLGNIIGSHLPADVFARYCRLKGYETYFVGGTDEHGTAIEFAAQQKGTTPKKLCDSLYLEHKNIYDWFQISYDNFSRTSKKIHHELVKEFFVNVHKKGFITEKLIKIPYCLSCKKGLADRYITGICPHCKYDKANGDQCEKCATLINPIELIEPYCSVCTKKEIEFRDTKHLFLDLRSLEKLIVKWIKENKHFRKQVKNLSLGWLNEGLRERCITRDLKWGVDVPLKGYEDKVFYVWFDNVIGYVSSTVELLGEKGLDLWKSKDTETYYFLGKDNIPFHTIFWPGQIMAQGEFVLPHNVVGLQYLNFEGQKFSKSKNIGIFTDQVKNSGIPLDFWRFYLINVLPETKDTDFSVDDFKERINKELIGNFGNFVNRSLHFIHTEYKDKLPAIVNRDKELENKIQHHIQIISNNYEGCNLREALSEILRFSDLGNQYFNAKEPWKNKDPDILNYCHEICRLLGILFSPIIPNASKSLNSMLKTKDTELKVNLGAKSIGTIKILFKKLEEEDLTSFRPVVKQTFPLQMKVGKIIEVKDHPNADSLYLLKVDFKTETRQVVAGLKKYFTPDQLKNLTTIFVTNLKVAKLRGELSEAMSMIAEDKELSFLETKAKVGEEVTFQGYTNSKEEVTFEQFSKLKLKVKDKKVYYKDAEMVGVTTNNTNKATVR